MFFSGGGGFNPFKSGNDQAVSTGTSSKAGSYVDLSPYIDQSKLECLNFNKAHPLQHALFENNDSYYLESDCDPQIVINMGFTCPVKIHHLVIRAFNDNTKPSIIKLFVNTKTLGFSECENDDATQEIELKEKDFKEDIPLKFVKFQAVKTLTIFFSDNGGDKTKIIKLGLFGSADKETDMKNLKKIC